MPAQPFIGDIVIFAGTFAPAGWMFCAGQLLPISEYETLFNLIGTTYGGDGQSTFALPDLRGRLPVHQASLADVAQMGGVEQVTLTTQQVPIHTHALLGSSSFATATTVKGNVPAAGSVANVDAYGTDQPATPIGDSISAVGGNQPHTNFQPYLCVNFIIALFGIYPSAT